MSSAIRGAIPVVCNMLAGTLGVEVEWGNCSTASTDGKRVRLPNLPLEGDELRRWVYGYIGHEAGHIRGTDFDAWPGAQDSEMLKDIANLLEDPRIERLTCDAFPGVKRWLNDLTEALLEEGLLGRIDPEDELVQQVRNWLLFKLAYDVMGYPCLQQLAQQQDQLMDKVFAPETMAALRHSLASAAAASCTQEIVCAAREIVQALGNALPAPPPPPPPPPQEGEDGSEQGLSEGPAGGADGSSPDDQSTGGQSPQGEPTQQQIQDLQQQISQLTSSAQWGQKPSDKGAMVEAKLEEKITDAQQHAGASGSGSSRMHMPAVLEDSTCLDGAAAVAAVKRESMAIRAKLEELVEDVTITKHRTTRSGRRLVRDAAIRVSRGNPGVFDRRTEGIDVDAAVMLLIDKSGSMKARLVHAAAAAVALSVSFAEVEGVDTAVSAFPETVTSSSGAVDGDGVRAVKRFDEGHRDAVGRIMSLHVQGSTPLASAMLHCHQQLLEHSRQKRLLVVLTDGAPDNLLEAMQVIAAGRRDGIEHLGLGIGVELGHLFDTFVRIDQVADLPAQVLQLVRDALFQREQCHFY